MERKTISDFDPAGNLESTTDAAERVTSYTYDDADRLTEASYSDEATPSESFEYDADGNLVAMGDGSGESSFEYDQLGRMTGAEDGQGAVVGYEYNLADEQTAVTYPNEKSISRAFDNAGRLESVTDWLEGTTSFGYDADSNLTSIAFPAGTGNVDEYSYDRAGRMEGAEILAGEETLASLSYARDKLGQVESTESSGLPGPEELGYGYDKNERLTEAGEASYGYDSADNLTEAPGTTNAYDGASQLETGTGVAYTYNSLGERAKTTPEAGPATTYGYDQAGRLTSIERPAEGEVPAIEESFGYDGTGLMVKRSVGEASEYLTWDRTSGLPLLLADGENSYIYGPGRLAIEQISEGAATFYHHDQLGSTRMLTNTSGEATATFSYSAYGQPAGSTGTQTTPLGYAGQLTNEQSGLIYIRARFYDPVTGQFLTRDPLVAITGAPYGYAETNPLNFTDPTGLGPCLGGFLFCDDDDEPCSTPLSTSVLCLVPDDAGDEVTNAAAGAGDSLLSPIPFVDLPLDGPFARDLLGIDNVDECTTLYRGSRIRDFISLGKGSRGIARQASRFGAMRQKDLMRNWFSCLATSFRRISLLSSVNFSGHRIHGYLPAGAWSMIWAEILGVLVAWLLLRNTASWFSRSRGSSALAMLSQYVGKITLWSACLPCDNY